MKKEHSDIFTRDKTIHIFGSITTETVGKTFEFLDDFEMSSDDDITIVMCSEGGDIYPGLALYDRIRQCKNNIIFVGTGMIMSIATIIFLSGDKRVATQNTRFMNHQGIFDIQGKPTEASLELKEADILEKICANIVSSRTNVSTKYALKSIKTGNDYFGAEKALKDGYIEEILINQT